MSETRLQRYKAWLFRMARGLWGILTRLKTVSITGCRRGVARGRVWGRTLSNVLCKAGSLARRHAFLLIVIFALILFGLAEWLVPQWHVAGAALSDQDRLELMDKTRGTLAQIFAGLGIALGLYFTWSNLAVAKEGQITERFTRAIDQLGSDRLEIRLGGIYALERIARDSDKDHWSIMDQRAHLNRNPRFHLARGSLTLAFLSQALLMKKKTCSWHFFLWNVTRKIDSFQFRFPRDDCDVP